MPDGRPPRFTGRREPEHIGRYPPAVFSSRLYGRITTQRDSFLHSDLPEYLRENLVNRVEVLPYDKMAGGKYPIAGRQYTPDYPGVMARGYTDILKEVTAALADATETEQDFLRSVQRCLISALDLAERYRKAAQEQGHTELASTLTRIPMLPPTSLIFKP